MDTTLYLSITGGRITPRIKIPKSATVIDLKEQIRTETNMDVRRQTLKFNNQEMMDHRRITDYGILLVAEIALKVTPLPDEQEFNILVKYAGEYAAVKVKETTSVAELMLKIWELRGRPDDYVILTCKSMRMEAEDALSAYYICEGSVVEMILY